LLLGKIPQVIPDPDKVTKKDVKVRRKLVSDSRGKGRYCFVCDLQCTNEYNYIEHLGGLKHHGVLKNLHHQIMLPGFNPRWRTCEIEKVKANTLSRGDVIFVPLDEELLKQGVVIGRTVHGRSSTLSVQLTEAQEIMVTGGESVFRILDLTSLEDVKSEDVKSGDLTPTPEPLSEFERIRVQNMVRNQVFLEKVIIENPTKKVKLSRPKKQKLSLTKKMPHRQQKDATLFEVVFVICYHPMSCRTSTCPPRN
jgi:hypothetical protein